MDKQIFFVDDDLTMLRLFSLVASKNHWVFDTASSLQEFLDKIAQNTYQIIFMDIEINDEDSLPHIRTVKEKSPQTKVIMVSGHTFAEYYSKVKEAGADDYFPKPIKIDELIKKAQEYIH